MKDEDRAANRTDTSSPSESWLEAGWLLIAILIPLWVNLWAQQPFEPAKAALLRLLAPCLAGAWLIRAAVRPTRPAAVLSPLWVGLILAWALAQILCTVAAVDRGLALWGSYDRGQGLATLLCYPLLFAVVAAEVRCPAQGWRLVHGLVATGLPVSLLALAQALGYDPLGLISDARSPAYATLGRANFVGAYLAMLLPLTAGAGLAATRGRTRFAWGALALLDAAGMAVTAARGAWLAAAAGGLVLALLYTWPVLPRFGRRSIAFAAALALPAGLALALWLGRASAGSTAARFTIWRAALDLVARRPWLGYGPDNLVLVFPQVFPPELVYYQGRGMLVDRAHNWLLDTLLSSGVLGLLVVLAIGAAILAVGWGASRGRAAEGRPVQARLALGRLVTAGAITPERTLILACVAALVGNAAGNLVSFDVTPTATTAWLLLALVASLARTPATGNIQAAPGVRRAAPVGLCSGDAGGGAWRRAGCILAGCILIAAAVCGAARFMPADMAARQAYRALRLGDLAAAAVAADRAAERWPREPAHRLLQGWVAAAHAHEAMGAGPAYLARGEDALLAATALRPGDFTIWAALGDLYAAWAAGWDATRMGSADAAYRQAAHLAPDVATVHAAWGASFLRAGQPAEARPHLQRAVDLDATDGQAYADLGAAELALGHIEAGHAAYAGSVRWSPDLVDGHLGLARCTWLLGRPADALVVLERALQLDPTHPDARSLHAQWTGARAPAESDSLSITP